ncbi:MoaD/ThiS family protein [Candidatus Woesearchaeota archaeon]|nr:MoaD/ThiS family protein [Candidatus Woesearchaeota archaeon]
MEIKPDARIIDLLKLLKINPVTVIVSKNKKIVVEETPINSKDRIEIYSVVSGG